MSIVFIAAETIPLWQESVLLGLLAISVILCAAWLAKSLVKGGPLRGVTEIADRPGLMELILVLTCIALLDLGLSWVLDGLLESKSLEANLAGSLASLLGCGLILGFMGWKHPRQFKSLGLGSSRCLGQLGWGLIIALAVWPLALIVLKPISFRLVEFVINWGWCLSYTIESHSLLRELGDSAEPMTLWLTIAMAVVIAPLTEEILFRGLLQGALSRLHLWRWSPIIISAAIFALVHLSTRANAAAGESSLAQVETIPPLFFLGLVLGYSYEKSGSLYRPIWIHVGFNALSMILWLTFP